MSLPVPAPEPRRGPPVQGHWAENAVPAWQIQQEREMAEDRMSATPRSIDEYSIGSLPSAAPEFYDEEPVTLSRVEEVLAIEHGLREACRTLPVTIASWMFFTLMIFFHGQVQGGFACADTIKQSMLSINVPAVNGSTTLRELRIGTLTERYDIIQWIKLGLVPTVTMPGLRHGQLRRTQQLLGKIRVSQQRGVPDKCGMNAALERFHPNDCHPPGGEPEPFGTAKLDYYMSFEPYTLGADPNKFVAWLDIGRPMATLEDQFQALLDFDWLDDDTQTVSIMAIFLNPEMNVYSKMVIDFNLHRGGWIQQSISVTAMRGDVYYHWAVVWLDAMWVTILFLLVWQATLHMIEEVKKGLFWYWATDFFVLFDGLSLLIGGGMIVFFWSLSESLQQFVQRVVMLGMMPETNGIESGMVYKTRAILDNWKYEKKVEEMFDNFHEVNYMSEWFRLIAFMYNLVIVARFYRGFTGQPRIAIILQTMTQVSSFMFHYLLVFVVIIMNFAICGYILFGEEIADWSQMGKAVCSAVLMLFGRFDYNGFHSVAPINALLWFSSFFICAVMIFTGLTTATILHHYLGVRLKTGQAGESMLKQFWHMISDLCYARTYDGAQKSLPPDKLFEMITMDTDPLRIRHLGRFNIDRRLRTRHDIHEAELDPKVDAEFLLGRGMDPVTAERLLDRISESGHHIEMRSSPVHRLTLFIARQMSMLRFGAEHMRQKTTSKVEWAAKAVDRVDLKHAKCLGLATRLKRAQTLPPGWTEHRDGDGRRYLRQEETGLTSWTLPRHLI
jgi:hypothetical protein